MFCARAQDSGYRACFWDVGTVGGAADVLHIAGQSVTRMELIVPGSDRFDCGCASPEAASLYVHCPH